MALSRILSHIRRRRLFSCRQPLKTALAYDFARHEHYGHLSTVRAWTFLYRFKICSDYPNVKNMNYYITTDYNLQAPFFSSVINHKASFFKHKYCSCDFDSLVSIFRSRCSASLEISPSFFTSCSINVSSAQAMMAGLPTYLA